MTKKQLLLLLLVFLLGIGFAELVAAQSRIEGPERTPSGTLATFEIHPAQMADWTITSVETTEKVFQTDTSTNRLYFATPQPGMYHIIAAIVLDGKPQLLTKMVVNGNEGEIKPPLPPVRPDQPFRQWIQTQLPVLVQSEHRDAESRLVAGCFEQVVQKIESGTIKTAQNARAQLQIALTGTLAMASDTAIDDWHDFITQLSQQMATELGDDINDPDAVKTVFQTVAEAVKSLEFEVGSVELKEKSKASQPCEKCKNIMFPTPNSTLQPPHFRQFRLFR